MALIVAGLFFALVVIEIGFRAIGVSHPILYVVDDYRGWALRPGINTRSSEEGDASVKISSAGLRDREHLLAKPENTIRVAVLGDSFTEAQQVEAEDTFWAVIEDNLRQCDSYHGQEIEVINFGVAGYGTAQELLTLRHFVWDYSPDVVLLAFFKNDFTDNFQSGAKSRPYFTLKDGNLVLDNTFRESSDYKFKKSKTGRFFYYSVNHSRVLQVVNKNKRVFGWLRSKVPLLAAPRALAASGPQSQSTIENEPVRHPQTDAGASAVELTEELIATMNREVAQHDADFALIYVTSAPIFRPDLTVESAAETLIGEYESGMENLGRREGFPVLNLAPEFLNFAAENRVYLHIGGGHWNETGHKLAGDLTSEMICQNAGG